MIPFSNPSASYQAHKIEINQAIQRVLNSGWLVLGQEVESFEKNLLHFMEIIFMELVLLMAQIHYSLLRSLGLGRNDEIITSSHTLATVAGIEQANCTPVFADIEPTTRCIDPCSIGKRINTNTKAIMPVHIYGQPCDMTAVVKIANEYGLKIIEDCSQAHEQRSMTKVAPLVHWLHSVVIPPKTWVEQEMAGLF